MSRQRQLERCGWRFWRTRGGTFYRNPEAALEPLWELLEKQGIRPQTEPATALDASPAPDAPAAEPSRAEQPRPTKSKPARRGEKAA
jgi:hypothetical protein